MKKEILRRKEIILRALPDIGKYLKFMQSKNDLEISRKKNLVDLVTEADKGSEEMIVKAVLNEFPDDHILGEEGGTRQGKSDFRWVIDPLDGTTNFTHKLPLYAVSIGLEYIPERKICAGFVLLPALDELYHAVQDEGSYKNDKRIYVSSTEKMIEALFCTGFPYRREDNTDRILEYLKNMLVLTRGIRRTGAAALDLCWVAEGRFDGFWEESLSPWDIAAGGFIIQQAGGKVSTFDGNSFSLDMPNILATNAKIYEKALLEFKENLSKRMEHY
ncbi:MAG TPA: inositol monophosphatase family protein [Leptospiraceae bacterium]|nr:inositol monophosphatase family protein [Leptospiraceae bacterium]HMY65360.1 inositol monophosphatase family protein [Leptospiraceae bacterium]HNF14233.1 inositol monophosphatase family protein [Leptospiraceae bacterium]HNF23040.1 inositol monophosphatase family protein [Leptospiraceae bacterium]HNH07149.1 inositol monophosphatase family protein [Leptospiraceae bacterium]